MRAPRWTSRPMPPLRWLGFAPCRPRQRSLSPTSRSIACTMRPASVGQDPARSGPRAASGRHRVAGAGAGERHSFRRAFHKLLVDRDTSFAAGSAVASRSIAVTRIWADSGSPLQSSCGIDARQAPCRSFMLIDRRMVLIALLWSRLRGPADPRAPRSDHLCAAAPDASPVPRFGLLRAPRSDRHAARS